FRLERHGSGGRREHENELLEGKIASHGQSLDSSPARMARDSLVKLLTTAPTGIGCALLQRENL
ncbi:MAG TPA: hypothetical protein VMS37_13930, partial [Verrucomicrobiae bacterium]|nr:hypothetical protein [Verrucomicrobiae bacterium]